MFTSEAHGETEETG